MPKYCVKCGAENRDQARFCKKCGESLAEVVQTTAPAAAPELNFALPVTGPAREPQLSGIEALARRPLLIYTLRPELFPWHLRQAQRAS